MQTSTINKAGVKKVVDHYQRFPAHIYKTKEGLWRGFVAPYDVTHEAKTKKEVENILPKLVELYEEGLVKYKNPSHLVNVPLSDEEDIDEFLNWTKSMVGK